MKLTTRVKPISYLTSHAAEIAKEISDSREPMVFTQDGEAKLIVMDVATYEEQQETMALLKILALGGQEIEQGDFRSDEAVFAELDKEDAE
jgi:PHD/YefM family antitoxin component YafN of YafNO toxin-antitoxin module